MSTHNNSSDGTKTKAWVNMSSPDTKPTGDDTKKPGSDPEPKQGGSTTGKRM